MAVTNSIPDHLANGSTIVEPKKLNIAIVGAGIAGLGAAIALSQNGHSVEIFERSRFSNEVGAAIHVCPNASRILTHWGFDYSKAHALEVEQSRIFKGDTLDLVYTTPAPVKYGSPWYFLHRVDLHSELKRLALSPGPDRQAAQIKLSAEVVDVDCEAGILRLANGETFEKDLIIAADGVHSIIAQKVIGKGVQAAATGSSAFRFLIPTEVLLQNPITQSLFKDVPTTMNIATGPDRRIAFYPCRGGTLQNFVGIHPDLPNSETTEEWNVSASVEDLLASYSEFHPVLKEVCRNAEDLKLWKLLYRNPIPKWSKGKVLLIGDAAHPMLPHQGQGGGQALEDGAALGALFADVQSLDEIGTRLQMFQQVRKSRASAMQIFSNAGQDEAEKIEADARPYVDGPVPRNQAEFHEYNFGYNIFQECAKVLEAHKAKVGRGKLNL